MWGCFRKGSKDRQQQALKWLSIDPSPTSRLGDVGYVCTKGLWRVVLNIFNQNICELYGIKAIVLAADLDEYIVETPNSPHGEPLIELRRGGSYRLVTLNQLDRCDTVN
jgi:hypothetical protein